MQVFYNDGDDDDDDGGAYGGGCETTINYVFYIVCISSQPTLVQTMVSKL